MSDELSILDIISFIELDEYIAFDLETTCLNQNIDKITEVSACKFVDGKFEFNYCRRYRYFSA